MGRRAQRTCSPRSGDEVRRVFENKMLELAAVSTLNCCLHCGIIPCHHGQP